MFCPYCGKLLPENTPSICPYCQSSLATATLSATAGTDAAGTTPAQAIIAHELLRSSPTVAGQTPAPQTPKTPKTPKTPINERPLPRTPSSPMTPHDEPLQTGRYLNPSAPFASQAADDMTAPVTPPAYAPVYGVYPPLVGSANYQPMQGQAVPARAQPAPKNYRVGPFLPLPEGL